MENAIPDVQEPKRRRIPIITNRRVILFIVIASLLGSCSTSTSGCGGCNPSGCGVPATFFLDLINLIRKLIAPQCEVVCEVKVQFFDAATGQNLTGVQPGSSFDFDLFIGGTKHYDGNINGARPINADGTMFVPLNPCVNLVNGSLNNVQSFRVDPYGGGFKATHGCPAGTCRTWMMSNTASMSLQGMEGCVPVIRVPVSTRRSCVGC